MKNIFVLEAQIYTSLAHPKRLEILHLLSHGSLSVSQIVSMTGCAQANVSQHLMVLKKLNLVVSIKQGQQRFYELASQELAAMFEASRSILLARYGVAKLDSLNRVHLHTDPVCGMEVTAKGAAVTLVHNYTRFYFCATGCAKRFEKNPTKFLAASAMQMKESHE